MLAGVPNLAFSIGYTNASWTLKCDLTCDWVCRLLNHMEERGYARCVPEFGDAHVVPEPMIDFSSGYVQRSIHLFPKQGAKVPWRLHQNYPRDVRMLRYGAMEDGALRFTRAGRAAERPGPRDRLNADQCRRGSCLATRSAIRWVAVRPRVDVAEGAEVGELADLGHGHRDGAVGLERGGLVERGCTRRTPR